MQLTAVVTLVVLFIKYNIITTNVANTDIKTEQIGQNII